MWGFAGEISIAALISIRAIRVNRAGNAQKALYVYTASMSEAGSQLSNFLKTFGGRSRVPIPEAKAPAAPAKPEPSLAIDFQDDPGDDAIFGDSEQQSGLKMQLAHMENILQMKTRQVERLQAEIRTLLQFQNSQAIAIEMALQDRRELERQLAQMQTGGRAAGSGDDSNLPHAQQAGVRLVASPAANAGSESVDESAFLRAFLRKDQSALDDLVRATQSLTDKHARGLAGQAMFVQLQKYMQLNAFFARLTDESGTDNFITTFESNVRNFIDSRRILLWARIPSARVVVSRTASMIVPEGEGLLGRVVADGQRIVLTDPSRDPSYSMDYDGPLLSTARVSVFQPVANSRGEVLWIIQIIDRLSSKGSVVVPSDDDMVILDFLSLSLIKLYQEESRIDEMIKRILTESTRSLLIERQVMPLLETVQLTVTHIVGCESLQILFVDAETHNLFQIREAVKDSASGVNFAQVTRVEIPAKDAGIAGIAYTGKKSVNVAVAKEHSGFNRAIDGEFPNGAALAVPLLSSKGSVSLVAVARQKRNGMMFTDSDEIILEALSRVSQGALANAQSHERNIQEIQRALNNHKYYTALLAVAQELSSVLDTSTLVRKIMAKAQSFIGADRCSLFLVDKQRGALWSMVAHGATDRIWVPLGGGIAGHVAQTGETLNIPDAYHDPRFNSAIDKSTGYRTRSVLCVAIRSGSGEIIGCTQMINKLGAPEFSETDVELMTAFNVFCGIALSNAQLFEAATQSKKKMTAMLDIALSLSNATTLDALATNLMERARELIEAESCWLFVNDRVHHVCHPLAAGSDAAAGFSIKQDPVGYVTITGTELNIANPRADPRFDCVFIKAMKLDVKSTMVLPVIDANGQIIGAVQAINKKGMQKFALEDESLLRAFASFAGLAIDQWLTKRPGDFGMTEINLFETLSPTELTGFVVPDKMKLGNPMTGVVSSQRFDVFACTKNNGFQVLVHCFDKFGLLEHFRIPLGTLLHFLDAVYNDHDDMPFHSWNRAVGGTQFLFWELVVSSEACTWEKLDLLILIVAMICQDIGKNCRQHVTNKKAAFPLSILYPDAPVLGIFHCSAAIAVLSQPNCNIIATLTQEQTTEFWSGFIECILAADPSQHSKLLSEAEGKLSASHGAYDLRSPSAKALLMKLLVKCALVSQVGRMFGQNEPWARFLCEEAVPRGYGYEDEGGTSAAMHIDANSVASAQVKYMSEVCAPMFQIVSRMVQPLQAITDKVLVNLAVWKKFAKDGQDEGSEHAEPGRPAGKT